MTPEQQEKRPLCKAQSEELALEQLILLKQKHENEKRVKAEADMHQQEAASPQQKESVTGVISTMGTTEVVRTADLTFKSHLKVRKLPLVGTKPKVTSSQRSQPMILADASLPSLFVSLAPANYVVAVRTSTSHTSSSCYKDT